MYSFTKHILLFAPYIFSFLFAISRQFYVKSFWSAICFQIKLLANYSNYTYRKNIYLELMLVLLWTKTDDILQQPGVSLGTSTTWPYNCSTGIFRVKENLLVTNPVNFEIVKFKPNALNYVQARVQILSLHIPSHTKPIKKASSRQWLLQHDNKNSGSLCTVLVFIRCQNVNWTSL